VKLSLQEGLCGCEGFRGFLRDAKEWGFDAVEVWGEGLEERLDEVVAALREEGATASSVCPGGGGIRGTILSEDAEEAKRAAGDIDKLIDCCARLDGAGLIIVPEFGEKKFMALYPDHGDFERRKGLFAERLESHARRAERLGVRILLEPLNRYEAFFMLTVGQAAETCRMLGSPAVRVIADLFHMGIEEDNTAKAISDNIEWIDHVHLVDSNRKLPGQGEKDFAPALAALKNGGFDGYLCMECGVPGDDPAAQFKKSVKWMRDAIGRIG